MVRLLYFGCKMEHSVRFLNFLLNLVNQVLSPWTVEGGHDEVLVVVVAGAEVHVHQAVVDAKVLDMKEMMICMKVVSTCVLRFLGMTKLVVNAVLDDESV